MNKYDDIINLPHHESKYYKRMSLEERSAQFAPFDALEGYSEEVHETERLTSKRINLSEEAKEILNSKLNIIKSSSDIKVTITYFVKDLRKDGGSYKNKTGYVKKIDIYNQIRGLDGFSGTYAIYEGKRLKVWESILSDNHFSDLLDGEITNVYKNGIGVKVSDGEIILTSVQLEGKNRMRAIEFANGKNLVGKVLE